MDLLLQDRLALVTESTGGIGKLIAAALAREGAHVLINGASPDEVRRAVEELEAHGGRIEGIVADLGCRDGVEKLVGEIGTRGKLEILVSNVSTYGVVPFEEIDDSEWQKYFDLNVMSGVRLCRAFIDDMRRRRWGRVVFVSDDSAIKVDENKIHSCATSTAQLALARGLAQYLQETGVTVNSVLPGLTCSRSVPAAQDLPKGDSNGSYLRTYFDIDNRPSSLQGRFGSPEEAAQFVAFLCSPFAEGISGTVWNNGSRSV